jgi:hypothetical protein
MTSRTSLEGPIAASGSNGKARAEPFASTRVVRFLASFNRSLSRGPLGPNKVRDHARHGNLGVLNLLGAIAP